MFWPRGKPETQIQAVAAGGLLRPNEVAIVAHEAEAKPLVELFRVRILKMLRKDGMIARAGRNSPNGPLTVRQALVH